MGAIALHLVPVALVPGTLHGIIKARARPLLWLAFPAMENLDVQPYLDRAQEELHAVEVNIREELYAVAISRCYYAMFYAVSGLLASVGITRSKHSGVIAAFREHFVKTGLIEIEYGDILGVGFDARRESDYELAPLIDRELALKRLHDAQRFVDRIERYSKSTGTQ